MILRIAIATGDRTQAEELANRLVDLSVRGLPQYPELDLDVAFYQDDPRLLLSAFHLWEEPYDLASAENGRKQRLPQSLVAALLPLSFIVISMILWNLR